VISFHRQNPQLYTLFKTLRMSFFCGSFWGIVVVELYGRLLIFIIFMDKVLARIRKVVQTQRTFNPLLVTDIDGVLVRGNNPIPGIKEALTSLKS